tara:strand:+ start:7823 stop:8674 length:852 start_codon:yes stop_codon:yes gene_type:complete
MSGQGPVNPPMVHPGAVAAERVAEVPVRAQDLVIDLHAGQHVQDAICAAVADAGCDAAWVDVAGLVCAPFAYVMPAASPDGARVAWYSDTYRPDGPVRVSVGGISVGRLGQGDFTHCHGLWSFSGGAALGHMLAPDCTVAEPVTLRGVGLCGGRFERLPDGETGFDLFRACAVGDPVRDADAVMMTIRPNMDIVETIEAVAQRHGIRNGVIMGLGSVNGARFSDAPDMPSAITEFIITSGQLTEGAAQIALSAVDMAGDVFSGTVQRGGVPVSITAEIVVRAI